jgi:hypothetical protein
MGLAIGRGEKFDIDCGIGEGVLMVKKGVGIGSRLDVKFIVGGEGVLGKETLTGVIGEGWELSSDMKIEKKISKFIMIEL